jgi:hypothetical protein
MSDLIPKNTDEEMERYMEADMVRRARIPMEGNAALKFEHDPVTKRENAYFPLSSGGYVKIGDRAVTPEQAAETDVLAAEREIQNDARGPIGDVIGGAGGPTMEDYEAAGFTEAEVVEYNAQRSVAAETNLMAAAQEPGFGPAATLTEDQMQFGEEVGADFMRIAEEPPGVFEGTLSEIVKGLARGGIVEPSRFVKENFNLYDPLVFQVVDPRTGEFDPQLRIVSREEKAEIDRAIAAGEMPYAVDFERLFERGDAAETGPGAAMLGDIAQFMGAYAGVGKLFRIGKGITGGMTQGAAADFFGFGGDEGRITDLLLELGVPGNMVTDFLRTDPNDPDYVGRFKNALEGGVLGGLIEQIGPVYRLIKEGGSRTQLGQAIGDLRARSEQSFANTISDVIGTGRAVAQGDTEMLGEIFQRGGTPRSLGAAGTGVDDAALTRNTQEYLNQIGVAAPPSRGGFAGRISTRLPTAARATEDPMTGELIIGYDELRADPKVFEPNVNIVRDYPNMRPQPDATTDETAEQFITHVKDNLLYLHDQVPEATRTRSQLWYDGARNITDRWSREYGSPDTSIAGALAALSPQKDWYQNVSLAQRVLDVAARQQDFRMSNEMRGLFFTLRDAKGNPVFDKPKYVPLLESIDGKAYSEIVDDDPAVQNTLRALFTRLYDQTYNTPEYKIVSPEGDFLDVATNANGSPSRVGWGSLNEIGKAIGSIEANGVVSTISRLMGERHKVRNFYNNIYDPNSPYGDVTIDTHAVAAGLLRPLSGNSLEVDHNFKNTSVPGRGTTKGSAISGVSGNYGLYAEAYRRAAEERGILPRQMQSITWEAVRGLFPDTFKTEANANMIDAIWNRYRSGEIEIDEARRMVNEAAGGINPPTWQQ